MKKLLLLLPVTMLALAGCNTPAGGGTEPGGGGEGGGGGGGQPSGGTTYVINKEVVAPNIPEGKTYGDGFEKLIEGVKFVFSSGVGVYRAGTAPTDHPEAKYDYATLGLLQLKKAEGEIHNEEAISVSKVTVKWYVGYYATEPADYIPVNVKYSATLDGTKTTVQPNELNNGKVAGVKTEYLQWSDKYTKNDEIYEYTTTYNIPSGQGFLSISGSTGGASYWGSVTIA